MLGGYPIFPQGIHSVDVRNGMSFIPDKQGRRNLDREILDVTTLEQSARGNRTVWA